MILRFPKLQKEASKIFAHRIRNQELEGFLSPTALVVDAGEAVDQQASPCQLRPQKGAPIAPQAPLKVLTISNVKFSGSDAEKSFGYPTRIGIFEAETQRPSWMRAAMSLVETTSVTLRGTSALLSC